MFPARGEQFTSLILKFKNLDACPSHTYRNLDVTCCHTLGLHHVHSCGLAAYLRLFAGIAAPWQAAQSLGVGLYKSTVLPLIIWTFLWQAPHRTFWCAPFREKLVRVSWSNNDGFHLKLLWHSAHAVTLLPLANCPPWMFSWHCSHLLGAALKSACTSLVPRSGGL